MSSPIGEWLHNQSIPTYNVNCWSNNFPTNSSSRVPTLQSYQQVQSNTKLCASCKQKEMSNVGAQVNTQVADKMKKKNILNNKFLFYIGLKLVTYIQPRINRWVIVMWACPLLGKKLLVDICYDPHAFDNICIFMKSNIGKILCCLYWRRCQRIRVKPLFYLCICILSRDERR